MANKVIEKMDLETSDLKNRNRTLTRRLNEAINEKNHEADQRRQIHEMYFGATAAIRDEKAQEICPAVSFYAVGEKSVIWNHVDSCVQEEYLPTVEFECYPVVQKSHYSFLSPGVDICVTVRDKTASQDVQHVLRQIADAIHNDPDIAHCAEDDDEFDCPVEIVNGILLAK